MSTLRRWALALLFSLVLASPSAGGVVAGHLIFRDRFENGVGDWTTTSRGPRAGETEWELGAPTNVGPPGAFSGLNLYGTNIDSRYFFDVDARLLSPVIDLGGLPDATLQYAQFRDIEVQFDSGQVSILDADSGLELVQLATGIEGTSSQWEVINHSLPASVLDRRVQIEFRFQADDFSPFPDQAGWYIDDVEVRSSVPEPAATALLLMGALTLLHRRRR